MKKPLNVLELVNFVGSIASITGISLLWLQSSSGRNVLFATPVVTIAALLVVGLTALCWVIFSVGYSLFAQSPSVAVKISYSCLAAALLLLLLSIAVYFIYLGVWVGLKQGHF